MIRAVLFDFGGVLTTSPFEAFARFEREEGLPAGFIRRINSTNPDSNAWARFERGQLSASEFDRAFLEESSAAGIPVRGGVVLGLLAGDVRPEMVKAVKRCGERFTTACLTNNFRRPEAAAPPAGGGPPESGALGAFERLRGLFDTVIESSVIGVRKPDPAFYARALEEVGAAPDQCVFLDDLGINLKPARALGMHTIKVVEPEPALRQLEQLTGLQLCAV